VIEVEKDLGLDVGQAGFFQTATKVPGHQLIGPLNRSKDWESAD